MYEIRTTKVRSWTLTLIFLNIIIYFITLFFPFLKEMFALTPDYITKPWILITHMFIHYDFFHLFFNMYALFLFGTFLEAKIGSRRFLIVYFTSGLVAALITGNIYKSAIGASAAIMGVIGALIVIYPDLQLLFFFVIPMSLRTAGIIWFLLDLLGAFTPSSVGNLAHIIGMATGLALGFYFVKKRNKFRKKFKKTGNFMNKRYITIDDYEVYSKNEF